ncbi:MAG: sensor histidine kinase [Thermobacillus sp.]|uniref:histidine kinase n=2 Tax=Thermobacillus TaxID=76632 RepID=L0EIF0_THECK|nr:MULTISPECIES: histidine kinase [Thermobacillus]AGA59394.1 putative signal transduction protein with a C-terminal ATPase domain [Thermobacillus composti KWC4]REK58418.1 MAG: sensor histidine kinase [Thermobacillus sp.]CAG5082529.1 Histidine kinase [Thermobacillus xylanilyticus]
MKRLRSVILQRIVLTACVNFVISGMFTYFFFEYILKDQMIQEDRAQLAQTARQLEYMSDDIANFAFTLIISEPVQSFFKTYNDLPIYDQFALFDRTMDHLDSYRGLRKEVASFALVLPDGQTFWSEAGYDDYFAGKLQEPWYANFVRSGAQFALTVPHRMLLTASAYEESEMISFIVAVRDIAQPNREIGKFIVNLDYSHFRELLDYGSEGFEGLVWLNDAGDVLYARGEIGAAAGIFADTSDAGERFERDGAVVLVDKFEKQNWKLAAVIDKGALLIRGRVVIYLLVVFSLVSMALNLLLMMPAILRMSRPILRLYQAMNTVSSGNLLVSVDIRTGDELERLGQGFNRMVRELRVHLEESIRHEQEKRELELHLLLSQLNPHFVYNTLNAVIYMARRGRNDDIVQMVGSFIRLLQDAARTGSEHALVTLREEIALLKDYVAIQAYRYTDLFEVEWQLDERAMDGLVPRHLLQPLVENAIFHGICPDEDGHGTIRISAVCADDHTLVIRVEDDGVGIEAERLAEVLERPPARSGSGMRHIGLANTRQRLRHLYGGRAELRIDSVPGQGTAVIVELPLQAERSA